MTVTLRPRIDAPRRATATPAASPSTSTQTAAVPAPVAPLPSTSTTALPSSTTPRARQAGALSPSAARIESLQGRTDMRSSGARFLKRELKQMAKLVKAGTPCEIVFDLDNTLFDTRARTLAVGAKFDAQRAQRGLPPVFTGVTLDDVRYNGEKTAANLQALGKPLDDEGAAEFAAFWMTHFWSAPMMAHDAPMQDVLFWAQEAQRAGVRCVFLTGRSEKLPDGTASGFADASVAQLRAAGLDFVSHDDVHLKPDVGTNTLDFKVQMLKAFREHAYVGAFVTEGSRHVAGIERDDPSTPCVLLPCGQDDDAVHVPSHVPRLDAVF